MGTIINRWMCGYFWVCFVALAIEAATAKNTPDNVIFSYFHDYF